MSAGVGTQHAPTFLRQFYVDEGTMLPCRPLVRFRFERFDEVVAVLEKEGYTAMTYTDGIFAYPQRCTFYSRQGWLMIIRKDGEPSWNIVRLRSSDMSRWIDDAELRHLVFMLKNKGIGLALPKGDEYIPRLVAVNIEHTSSHNPSARGITKETIGEAQIKEAKMKEDLDLANEGKKKGGLNFW